MSICSICDETRALLDVHRSDVVLCTVPGATPLLRHTIFPSDTNVYRLAQILRYFNKLRFLTLHVPEYLVGDLKALLGPRWFRRLGRVEHLHINIMNQNIDLLPPPHTVADLRHIASELTMTTAHERYCTEDLRERYRMPVHHLSVRTGADLYEPRAYVDKENVVVFSPDNREKNDQVIRLLAKSSLQLDPVVIDGVAYSEYRQLLQQTKWTFTFGEGLDFYFVETVFSGGIAIAVWNDRFFAPKFAQLTTVYASFNDLLANLVSDMTELSDPATYANYHQKQLAAVSELYNVERFRNNLQAFYQGEYTWR